MGRDHGRHHWRRRFLGLTFLTAVLTSSFPVTALGAEPKEEEGRKVRIGWYNSDHFQEGADEDMVKRGYSYEYIQSIANYTGWEYEYVYGGWSELYDAFIDGDIDLLAGLSYTEERADRMNYPAHEMGYESYYIYKKSENDQISGADLSTLAGKKVGTLENNLMTDYFEEWLDKSGVACEEVLFEDFALRDEALEKGEIDAFIAVNNNVASDSGYSPVVMVGESSYYLAVAKERTDLLAELNKTLTTIHETNPYFTESLQIKYFKGTAVNAALTREEKQWVEEHDSIKVGYIDGYMPFCGKDDEGNVTGVITDIFHGWQEQLGLEDRLNVEYVPFNVYREMLDSLRNGELDVVFPINDSIWLSEQEGIVQTNALLESSVYLIHKGEYTTESTKVIALSPHSPFQYNYAAMNYPGSRIYMAENVRGCLDAVKNGEATCTFFNSGRAEEFLGLMEYESLNRLSLGENVNYCMGVKKGNNVVYSLLERGVGLLDKSTMTNEMYKYTNFSQHYTLMKFFRDHMKETLILAAVIGSLVICAVVVLAISLKRMKHQNAKEQEMLAITRKQKEELEVVKDDLQAAVEKAEKASRAKTTFLFNMSHDIRTPMNAILGFADLALKNKNDKEKQDDYLTKIRDAGNVLLSILNNVLEMSRIESGTMTLEEEACDMEEFDRTLFTMFEEQMAQKHISLNREMYVKDRYVYCDVTRTREIFLNILSNAYKYTDEGGEVYMKLEQLPTSREGYMVLRSTIRDTGKGMSKEYLPTLFDEFSRENNSVKNTIEGTGLGMSIVKRLVDMMGGTIEVDSEPGKGTTFVICIPHRIAKEEDVKKKNEVKPEEMDFTGKRILLAEDMDINAEIAITILEEAGFKVERAEDGRICVEMLQEKPAHYYDLILMDVQMPHMNGYEASRAIRALEDKEKGSIPILAMTANAFAEDKKNALDAGMNGHLGKPIVVEELFSSLEEVLRGE